MNNDTQNPSDEDGSSALIPVFSGEIAGQSIQLCNARDLHRFLGVARDFPTWMKKRLKDGGFIQDQDYLIHQTVEQLPSGTKHLIDYHLTLDCAKHLGMMERNEAGNRVRQYFIEMERKALSQASLPSPASAEPEPQKALPRELEDAIDRRAFACAHLAYERYRRIMAERAREGRLTLAEVAGFEPSCDLTALKFLAEHIDALRVAAARALEAVRKTERLEGAELVRGRP